MYLYGDATSLNRAFCQTSPASLFPASPRRHSRRDGTIICYMPTSGENGNGDSPPPVSGQRLTRFLAARGHNTFLPAAIQLTAIVSRSRSTAAALSISDWHAGRSLFPHLPGADGDPARPRVLRAPYAAEHPSVGITSLLTSVIAAASPRRSPDFHHGIRNNETRSYVRQIPAASLQRW